MADVLAITEAGQAASHPYGLRLRKAMRRATALDHKLPDFVLSIPGMSGRKYRCLINNLVGSMPDARYLEVGSFAGSTCCAAIHGNAVRATCIDNWSLFGGPRDKFIENTERCKSETIDLRLIDSDFRKVDYAGIGTFNVYLFDGPHERTDQRDGVWFARGALDEYCVLIVDDWNWFQVRQGTFDGIRDAGLTVLYSIDIRTTDNDTLPVMRTGESDWHNGYFISVVRRARRVAHEAEPAPRSRSVLPRPDMFRPFLRRQAGSVAVPARADTANFAPPPAGEAWALKLLLSGEAAIAASPPAPPPAGVAETDQPGILEVLGRGGSPEHYYHFMLGFLAPILLRPDGESEGTRYLIPSCGMLDERLHELAIRDLVIMPKGPWWDLLRAGKHRVTKIYGFDDPLYYDAEAFARFKDVLFARLNIPQAAASDRLLIVNRGESPAFYQSDVVQNKFSAKLRRSVPNMGEARARLSGAGIRNDMVELETTGLRDQVILFSKTRVLVAQHGAALTNMLWMPPGGVIVEILPPVGIFSPYFSKLAEVCGHHYVTVPQAGDHEPIDPADLLAALRPHVQIALGRRLTAILGRRSTMTEQHHMRGG
jgi:hypothetical protein